MSNDSKDLVLTPPPEAIELRLDAELRQLHIARAVAVDFALRCDSDIDLIADMKVAVDELCINLMANALAASPLICRFSSDGERIVVCGQVMCSPGAAARQDTFGWRVLDTLADELVTWTEVPATQVGSHWLHIDYATRRPDPG